MVAVGPQESQRPTEGQVKVMQLLIRPLVWKHGRILQQLESLTNPPSSERWWIRVQEVGIKELMKR